MEKIKIKAVLYPKIYSNGTQPIFIRITQNRKSRYISVGYSIPKEAWNIKEVWEHKPSISENLKKTLSNEELKQLAINSFEASFISDDDKQKWITEVRKI